MSDFQSVKTTQLAATGTAVATRCRVKGIHYVSIATAAVITIRNGGASGTIVAVINTPATAAFAEFISFGDGILCGTDCHVTFGTAGLFVTITWTG